MVRNGPDCRLPDDGKRRDIQRKLARLMNEGNMIRSGWGQMMSQPEMQKRDAIEVTYWHAKIERYIETLPRSDFYLARLNSARRSDVGYPVGIDWKLAGHWDQLSVDLESLKELMDDPEFGKP